MATQAQSQGGPFDDERFINVGCYENLRIDDWNILNSAVTRLDVKEEKAGDEAIVYKIVRKCSNDDGDGDADISIQEAVKKLLDQSASYGVLTKLDTDEFWNLIKKAKKDFEFYDHMRQPGLIERDSSPKSVIRKLSFKWAEWFSYSDVYGLVESYISHLKYKHAVDLYYQYRLFLADCLLVERDADIPRMVEKLLECDSFKKKGYDKIPLSDLITGLECYISDLVHYPIRGQGNDVNAFYKGRIQEIYEPIMANLKEGVKTFPYQFTDPIHFLVLKLREEAYSIRHAALEIAKIRAYFNEMVFTVAERGLVHGGMRLSG